MLEVVAIKLANQVRKAYWFIFRPNTKGVRIILTTPDHKFILVKHKYTNGLYLPGGKIRKNENLKDAAVREIDEELGINLGGDALKFFGEYSNDLEYKKDRIYVFTATTDQNPALRSWEIKKFVIVEERDLDKIKLSEGTRNRLEEFLGKRPKSDNCSG